MKTIFRKVLPLNINKDNIEYILLSPLERHAISAEKMGISVIRVIVNNNPKIAKDYPKLKEYIEGAYNGLFSMDRAKYLYCHSKIERNKYKHEYFYFDKTKSNLEKNIRNN